MTINILHQDEHIIVVDKPTGLLTIPDRSAHPDSLLRRLQALFGEVFTVHRLDRETSGVLIFARTAQAHRHLCLQFEKHTADKFYLALLDGVLHHDEGEINKPVGEHPTLAGRMTIIATGKPSLTFYRVLERFRHFTWVEALIKTGRTHQIRVHFQSIGFPLAVDALYGRRSAFYLSEIKGNEYKTGKFSAAERPLLTRTALHAHRLRFVHPHTEKAMECSSPLPKDLKATLHQLQKNNTAR